MTALKRLACIPLIALLSACASPPPPRHVTLDDGRTRMAGSSTAPSVAVVRADIPGLIDRPQLVFRTNGNQVMLSDQYRWAEPLRHEIPRVIAADLGDLLDSSRVVALPADIEGFAAEFKLTLDVQQLDSIIGRGTEVDVLWRLEHRSGNVSLGRSTFRQPLAGEAGDESALVATQREAMRRVAADIANEIAVYRKCQHAAAHGKYRTEINLALCTVVNSTASR